MCKESVLACTCSHHNNWTTSIIHEKMKVSSLAGFATCTLGFSSRSAIAQLFSNTPKQGNVGVGGGEYGSGGDHPAMGEDAPHRELKASQRSTQKLVRKVCLMEAWI